mmetsp:Transcript_24743/g.61687  ORF Transcript_24743/g.61687 Transcript_24743/m.61687 type:complete len:270 (-) Transcript_24743:1581-2390(-)
MVTMPGLPPSSSAVSTSESAGRRAACGWWDPRSGAYKTSGCVALPSTFPPGTAPAWPVDESVTSGAMGVAVTLPAGAGETAVATALALAWRLESVETLGCTEAFLACDGATHVVDRATNASDAARYYFASEGDEVGSGGSAGAEFMTCNSGVPATLRWYRGARCPLWTRRTAVAAAAAEVAGGDTNTMGSHPRLTVGYPFLPCMTHPARVAQRLGSHGAVAPQRRFHRMAVRAHLAGARHRAEATILTSVASSGSGARGAAGSGVGCWS